MVLLPPSRVVVSGDVHQSLGLRAARAWRRDYNESSAPIAGQQDAARVRAGYLGGPSELKTQGPSWSEIGTTRTPQISSTYRGDNGDTVTLLATKDENEIPR